MHRQPPPTVPTETTNQIIESQPLQAEGRWEAAGNIDNTKEDEEEEEEEEEIWKQISRFVCT